MAKQLILGCCSTGAKYTPLNHRASGDVVLDRICTGEDIPVRVEQVEAEIRQLDALGCRYYHYHARNPLTAEQTTDDAVYRVVGRMARKTAPGMMLSYGASRNGAEVMQRIGALGEWERVSHAGLPLADGGAHFVTMQAAIELQILRDLEEQTQDVTLEHARTSRFVEEIHGYRASSRQEDVIMETNSTASGNNYGRSSPAVQMKAYSAAIEARRRTGLLHEVEWVQFLRSYAMTRFAIERPELSLASEGQLNITILFGFSPKLPFPQTYAEFRDVVRAAKSLEYDADGRHRRNVTVSVGAAVLPHHAPRHFGLLDDGRGAYGCAVEKLIAYAACQDSEVDIVRVGMEDTPYRVTSDGQIRPTTNVELMQLAVDAVERQGAEPVLDPAKVRRALNAPVLASNNILERLVA